MTVDVVEIDTAGVQVVEVDAAAPVTIEECAPIPGPPGPTGPVDGFRYEHQQLAPAAVWTIVHGLNGFPNVTVADSAGTRVEGDVAYLDANTVTVSFASNGVPAPFAGAAYLS